MTTALVVILLVLFAIFWHIHVLEPARKEAADKKGTCPEERELYLINSQIDVLKLVVYNLYTVPGMLLHGVFKLVCAAAFVFFLGVLIVLSPRFHSEESYLMPAAFAACVAFIWLQYAGRRKLELLMNRAKFLEDFLSVKHSGNYNEAELNTIKTILERDELEPRNQESLRDYNYLHFSEDERRHAMAPFNR